MKNKPVLKDLLVLIIASAIIISLFIWGKELATTYLFPLIKQFDKILRSTMIDLRSEMTLQKLIWFSGISFVYGIIHAAGPGHGKALFSAYFINRKGKISQVFTAAAALVLTHTLVSLLITVLFISVLKGTDAFFKIRMQGYIMGANGFLIFAVGMFLLFKKIINSAGKNYEKQHSTNGSYSPFWLGALAGCVPCPVTIFIMTFSLTYGIPQAGIASLLGLSAGMFVLTSFLGLIVVRGRDSLLNSSGYITKTEKVSEILESTSLVLIILIGAGMMAVLL